MSPDYLCVAVSTTSDAVNGGWNLYVFQLPDEPSCAACRPMTDYPKWGFGRMVTTSVTTKVGMAIYRVRRHAC